MPSKLFVLSRHTWTHSSPCKSHHFFSSSLIFIFSHHHPILSFILAPWTLDMEYKRSSWTPAPLSPLTLLGHHLILALTSRQSALTKSRLLWRLPVAVSRSMAGARRRLLQSKSLLKCESVRLHGGKHLFLEVMSKYIIVITRAFKSQEVRETLSCAIYWWEIRIWPHFFPPV